MIDVHNCSFFKSSHINYIYTSNLFGASISFIGCLITIISQLIIRYRRNKQESHLGIGNGSTGNIQHRYPLPLQHITIEQSQPLLGASSIPFNGPPYFYPSLNTQRKPRRINNLILYLSISDFIGCTFIIISQICIIGKFKVGIESEIFCIIMRCCIHFGFLSSFLWSNCIAFYLLRETYKWKPYDFPMAVFHIISWGIPLLCMIILVSGDMIKRNATTGWCTIDGRYQLYFWVMPMILSFIWNMLCYILIFRKFRQILSFGLYGSSSTQLQKHIARKLTLYLLSFLVCWCWDVANHTIFPLLGRCPPLFMWILQDCFATSQGFLNFIVYVTTNKMLPCCIGNNTSNNNSHRIKI